MLCPSGKFSDVAAALACQTCITGNNAGSTSSDCTQAVPAAASGVIDWTTLTSSGCATTEWTGGSWRRRRAASCPQRRRSSCSHNAGKFRASGCRTSVAAPGGSGSECHFCYSCPEGKYWLVNGQCNACPVGKYSDHAGALACAGAGCSAGQFSAASAGATAYESMAPCQACPAGQYASAARSISCVMCPTGKYASNTGSGACIARACSGVLAGSNGATSATEADAHCLQCSAGRWANGATGACDECPSGKYQSSTNQNSCDGPGCAAGQ